MVKQCKQWPTFLGGSKITADGDCSHEIKRLLLLRRKVMTNLESILKSTVITLPTKVRLVKAMFFSSSHVLMWELDSTESWVQKNWCFWTVVMEKIFPWWLRQALYSGFTICLQCGKPGLDPWVRSLGWEDPLEKEMATHSSTVA